SGYPEAYADHEHQGRVIASVMAGHSPEGLVCRLDDPTAAGRPDTFVAAVTEETGQKATADGRVVSVTATDDRHAWAVAARSVAQAGARNVTAVQAADPGRTRGPGHPELRGAEPAATTPRPQARGPPHHAD